MRVGKVFCSCNVVEVVLCKVDLLDCAGVHPLSNELPKSLYRIVSICRTFPFPLWTA